MLVNINSISLSFGSNELLNNVSLTINELDKVALIGRNGCGKTTLLRIINGELPFDSGSLFLSKNSEIAYLKQHSFSNENRTVLEEFYDIFSSLREKEAELNEVARKLKDDYSEANLLKYSTLQEAFKAAGGYDYENEIHTVFTGFGFQIADLKRNIASFSGGEKTKIAFASLLLKKPDLLLLDEPTNHLDLKTIEWLENYLASYKKAMLIVSHDRYFLDKTVKTIYELEYGSIKKYNGNYSSFVLQKEKDYELQLKRYKYQQKDIKRLEDLIEKFRYKKNKAAFAQSKIKFLNKLERIENPKAANNKTFKVSFSSQFRGSKDVLILDHLKVGYNKPLCEINLDIKRGDRICIMGENGVGKSTLLKTIMGYIPALSGFSLLGHQIDIGYFEQNLNQFTNTKTVIEELWDDFPQLLMQEIRDVLGAFLFSADEVFKTIASLSGGEKVRLALAKLMLKRANFLVLDEPTNHLDILSKEALEIALKDYDGSILFVSHDRYFISKIANKCLLINKDGSTQLMDSFSFDNLTYHKKIEEVAIRKEIPTGEDKVNKKPKSQYDLRKIEKDISTLEELLEQKRDCRFEPEYYQNSLKMEELNNEIDDIHNKIYHLMNEWELAMAEEELKKKH